MEEHIRLAPWLEIAEHMRLMARITKEPNVRAVMLDVAKGYDKLAKLAGPKGKPKSKSARMPRRRSARVIRLKTRRG